MQTNFFSRNEFQSSNTYLGVSADASDAVSDSGVAARADGDAEHGGIRCGCQSKFFLSFENTNLFLKQLKWLPLIGINFGHH